MISFRPTILIGLTFLMLAGFWLTPISSQAQSSAPNPPTIERAWYGRLADWAVNVWHATVNWIMEQGSHIARAFLRQSEIPVAVNPVKEPAAESKVLGEATSPPSPSGEGRGEGREDQTQTTPPSSEDAVSPTIPPVLEADHPPTPSLVKEGEPAAPEPAPAAPLTTPEIIAEPEPEKPPAQQSSSYFIPILARDTIAPASRVTAFASSSTATPGSATSSPFTVAWSGTDTDITGSPEVRSFDIQYQVDSGAWTDWLLETTLLSSLFTGVDEKNYGFRSRSRDRHSNLEDYSNTADASIYANLSIPTTPSVSSHNSGATLLSTTADEDLTSGSTVQVTLSGSGDIGDILTITLAETSATATTTITNTSPRWSKQFTLAEGANNFTLQTQESDGDNSSSALFILNLEMVPTREVVVNEIAWMGTNDSADEWIELYNASSTAINLAGWTVAATDGSPGFTISSGTIAAKSYFLMERFDDTAIFDITADFVYPGTATQNQMNNTGEELTLRDSTSKLIDKVGSSTVAWFAGSNTTKATMERKDPSSDGTLAASWASNDGSLVNGKASDNATALTATPKSLNSVNTTIPRSITDLQIQYIYTTTSSFRLYWTTPKTANLATTTPASYEIRYKQQSGGNCLTTLTDSNFSTGTAVTGPTPSVTQSTVATTTASSLSTNTAYCFAIKTNNGGETSGLSNVYTATTEDGNYTQQNGYPGSGILTRANSPYLVTADLSITTGQNLVIEAGTVVKMYGARNITVPANSSLIIATSTDSVNAAVITSRDDNSYGGTYTGSIGGFTTASDGTPTAGDWGNITTSAATSVVTLNHAIVAYGGSSGPIFTINAGTAAVLNSIIRNSSNYALALSGDSTSLTMATSTISNNLEGVGISTLANANITDSTFTGNHRGIAIGTSADEPNLIITRNNFFANNATAGATPFAGIHYSDTTGTLPATNNWWGSASGPTTTSPDSDATRDAAMADTTAIITYSPFATLAFSILPSGL